MCCIASVFVCLRSVLQQHFRLPPCWTWTYTCVLTMKAHLAAGWWAFEVSLFAENVFHIKVQREKVCLLLWSKKLFSVFPPFYPQLTTLSFSVSFSFSSHFSHTFTGQHILAVWLNCSFLFLSLLLPLLLLRSVYLRGIKMRRKKRVLSKCVIHLLNSYNNSFTSVCQSLI